MQKPYETIRSEFLQNIKNAKTRLIVESNLTALPEFEDQYFSYISEHPQYFEIYKQWILTQSPLPFPDDEKLLYLRNETFGNREIKDGEALGQIKWPIFFLLIDIVHPFIKRTITQALSYYDLKISEHAIDKQVMLALTAAAIPSLIFSTPENIVKEGYPDFLTSFLEKFKTFFYGEIALPHQPLPSNTDNFIQTIENEWPKLYPYSDSLYGFEVVPSIPPEAIIRYLSLPFKNQKYRYLSKAKIYREMMNYIVSLATFKPTPDIRIKAYFRQELCKLFIPLTANIMRRLKRQQDKIGLTEYQLEKIVLDELTKMTREFQFFYSTSKNLENKKISPFSILALPLNGQLAKIGHIYKNDEYPFTDYIVKKLESRIKVYFQVDSETREHDSIDMEFLNKEGDVLTLADIVEIAENNLHTRDYDAEDASGKIIGWKINTFAQITGKSLKTLRRWDKQGLLVADRYKIYAPRLHKHIQYRAYTRDHMSKVKSIEKITQDKMHHK